MAAVGTNNIDHVRGVVAALTTGGEVPAAPVTEQPVDAAIPTQPEQPQEQQQQAVGEVPPI